MGLPPEKVEELLAPSDWELLEPFLAARKPGEDFSAAEYAASEGIEREEASWRIQAYLTAQRGSRSKTEFVLHRVPGTRTRTARWAHGVRAKDARAHGATLTDDVRTRVLRALQPDLERVATLNPRATKLVEGQITAIVDGAMKVLEVAAQGSQIEPD
jgi:hypothetical protein